MTLGLEKALMPGLPKMFEGIDMTLFSQKPFKALVRHTVSSKLLMKPWCVACCFKNNLMAWCSTWSQKSFRDFVYDAFIQQAFEALVWPLPEKKVPKFGVTSFLRKQLATNWCDTLPQKDF